MEEYKISNFADLIRALKDHPEWLRKLRRTILTQEFLTLPSKFGKFRRSAKERLDAIEKQVQEVREKLDVLEKQVQEVKEKMAFLEQQMQEVEEKVEGIRKRLDMDVWVLKGMWLEMKVKDNIFSFFSAHFLDAKVISQDKVNELLSLAMEKGIISAEEREDVLRLDLIIEGTLLSTKEPVLMAVEVSYTIDKFDVQRVVRRADILKKAMGRKVLPAVVGYRIAEDTKKLITKNGCVAVLVSE
jgi:predicted transcriptional regulator